jgi:Ca-activated chloride channel family protein
MVELTDRQIGIALISAISAGALVLLAEWLHWRRIRRIRVLAFGPVGRPAVWVWLVSPLKVLSVAAVTWAMVVLILLPPMRRAPNEDRVIPFHQLKHIVLILDVSPSMRLADAGMDGDQSRMVRAREVMESYFQRIPMDEYRVTVIATYTKALPVVEDTRDINVVRNILTDLPMHYAFKSGDTELFKGISRAADVARGWRPNSTTVILVSDGDTVPSTGMPQMPSSVADVLVVGVGDPTQGSFINGRHSRQDVGTLRQIAARLRGFYHNGNDRHLPTELIKRLTTSAEGIARTEWTIKDWALVALLTGCSLLTMRPLLLHYFGTSWLPGVRLQTAGVDTNCSPSELGRQNAMENPLNSVYSDPRSDSAGRPQSQNPTSTT